MGNFYTFFSVHMSKAFYLSHCWLRLKICLPNPCVRRQTRQTYTSTSDDSEVDLGQRCCSDVWRQVNGFFRPCLVIVFGRSTSCMSIVLVYTTDIMLFSISKYYFFYRCLVCVLFSCDLAVDWNIWEWLTCAEYLDPKIKFQVTMKFVFEAREELRDCLHAQMEARQVQVAPKSLLPSHKLLDDVNDQSWWIMIQ